MAVSTDAYEQQKEFKQVALLTGRPLFWHISNQDASNHAKALHKLIQWCLDIPGGSLGIFSSEGGWEWVDAQTAHQWNDDTLQQFETNAIKLSQGASKSSLCEEFNQRRCRFFAPFQAKYFLQTVQTHFGDSPEGKELCSAIQESLASFDWSTSSLFWSLSLIQFHTSRDALIYTPMLALWSCYPTGGIWAPPPPPNLDSAHHLSLTETMVLLEDIMWRKLETIFTYIKRLCGLGEAQSNFAMSYNAEPPVFYFAQYVNSPSCIENLTTHQSDSLSSLVRTCLNSDDLFSHKVSGGILGGDFLTLRHEWVRGESVLPLYLIIPTKQGKQLTQLELEQDLWAITDRLSYLEFTITHEARDISTDVDSLSSRLSIWGGTVNTFSDLSYQFIRFLSTLNIGRIKTVYLELSQLMLPLRQIQSKSEQINSKVTALPQRFKVYRDSTEDYFDKSLTYSVCQNVQFRELREAIVDAYPYHYWQQPLQNLQGENNQLLGGLGRLIETLTSISQQVDRDIQASLEQWTRRLGIVAALAAPVLALPQLMDLKLDSTNFNSTLLSQVPNLNWSYLQVVVGYLLGFVLVILFITSLIFVFSWLGGLLPHRAEAFMAKIQSFEATVNQAVSMLGQIQGNLTVEKRQQLDKLDRTATEILSWLWHEAQDMKSEITQSSVQSEGLTIHDRLQSWLLKTQTRLRKQSKHLKHKSSHSQPGWSKLLLGGRSVVLRVLSFVCKGLLTIAKWLESWLNPLEAQTVQGWLQRSQYFRSLMYLFDLAPDVISLPRALCVYRYKADDFMSRTTISDWDLEHSLKTAGFDGWAVESLRQWLETPDNLSRIGKMTVEQFVAAIAQKGVRAFPNRQDVAQWQGSLVANGLT